MRGHLVKRSKGSWTIVLSLGRDPQTGKTKQQWQSVKGTKAQAEKVLADLLHRLDTGGLVKPSKLTVGTFLHQWLKDYAEVNTSPRTYERYEEIVRVHLTPALGVTPLLSLQPQHIQAYYSQALNSGRRDGKGGLSALTVYKHHRVLFEALKYAVKHGMLTRNVAEAVDAPRAEHKEMTIIGVDGVNSLLEAAKGTSYYSLFYTAIYTGLRRSELLGLRWQHVDLDMATLSVVETLHQRRDGGYFTKQPKSKKGRRSVAMSPALSVMLRTHKEEQEAFCEEIGTQIQATDLVFSHPDGSPIRPGSVTRAFKELSKAVGLNGLRFHDLRHTHATLMLQQGIHPKIVSERLGHSSIGITLDTYSHVLPGLQEAAAKRFEEGLTNGSPRVLNGLFSTKD